VLVVVVDWLVVDWLLVDWVPMLRGCTRRIEWLFRLLLLVALCALVIPDQLLSNNNHSKLALVITLAGNKKLVEYFEWSCKSIAASKELVDMLVFHENNQKLRNVTCADNVKFINLGERGLAEAISKQIIGKNESSESIQRELSMIIGNVLIHFPKYLVEIKPMLGSLFESYLLGYSHWSYTDPDIIFGNLNDWIDKDDLEKYDIITYGKNWDAGRLYLRGQVRE
jgi:hypothetical protein